MNLPVGVAEVKKPNGRARHHAPAAAGGDLLDLASLNLQSPPSAAAAAASAPVRSSRSASRASAAAAAAAVSIAMPSAAGGDGAAAPATAAGGEQGVGLDKPTLLGQIFDYMCMLRTQYGLRHVFGVVTNYAEWRIVWLPDTDAAAQASELPVRDDSQADPSAPLRSVANFPDRAACSRRSRGSVRVADCAVLCRCVPNSCVQQSTSVRNLHPCV